MKAIAARAAAIAVCPNARRCAHSARSTIGPGGTCPDCGRQVYRPGAPLGGASNRAAVLHTQISYQGAYEE